MAAKPRYYRVTSSGKRKLVLYPCSLPGSLSSPYCRKVRRNRMGKRRRRRRCKYGVSKTTGRCLKHPRYRRRY